MARGATYKRWLVGLSGLLLCLNARSQPAEVQVFSEVSRRMVAISEPIVHEVEVYFTANRDETTQAIEAAFTAAHFGHVDGLERVRDDLPAPTQGRLDDGTPVRVLRRRVVWRAQRPGSFTVPALAFDADGQTLVTPTHAVTAYGVAPAFFEQSSAIVPIVAERRTSGRRHPVRAGTAFLIAPDALVTSLHVVLDAHRIRIHLPDGQRVTTRRAWAIDPTRDVAVLYIDPKVTARAGITPLTIVPAPGTVLSESRPDSDETVFTYGWPGGVQRSTAGQHFPDATLRLGEFSWISNNPVRPGDSGGPLLDRQGRVLGVVTAGTLGAPGQRVLQEDLCVATDFRPALGQKNWRARPQRLAWFWAPFDLSAERHIQALRLASLLNGERFAGDLEATLAHFDAALDPGSTPAHLFFLQGMLYQLLGHPGDATAYQAALDAHHGHFLAAHMLALHHLRQGKYHDAEQLLREVQGQRAFTRHADYALANTLMGRHRYADAVPLLQEVIVHDPAYAPAYFDLARCYLALDHEVLARQVVHKLDALDPTWANRLRRVLREPVLQPVTLRAQPRAILHSLPNE